MRPELGVRAEDEVDGGGGPLDLARGAVATLVHVLGRAGRLPLRAHVEQVHEEVVGQRLGPVGEDAVRGSARRWRSAPACRRPAPSSRERSASACRPGPAAGSPAAASRRRGGSCGTRRRVGSSTANDSTSVCSCEASVRPGANGTVTSCPAFFAACSTAAQPPRTIRSASETFLPPDCEPLKSCWICSRVCSTVGQLGRLVDLPVLLRREADPRPVGPAALVGAAEARRRRPGGGDQLGDRTVPTRGSCALRAAMSASPISS